MKTDLRFIALCFFLFSSTAFAQQEARKFDSMGQVNCEDAKARLDNLAIQLQQEPGTKGYIIFYGGKSYSNYVYNRRAKRYVTVMLGPKRGESKARVAPWKHYLVDSRGVENSRIEVIDGGYREKPAAEFWIVPSGAKPPMPTPTLKEADIKFRKGRIRRGELVWNC